MITKIKQHWLASPPPVGARPKRGVPAAELIGAPDDRGVLNVGGRLGAGQGPGALRQALAQFLLGMDGAIGQVELRRGTDIDPGDSIESGHASLRERVARCLDAAVFPIVLGGGHDYGFPHVAGAFDALGGDAKRLAVINVDAHLDVRPAADAGITSGSPFWLALEGGFVLPRNFIELGIQEHCNDVSFREYVSGKGARIVTLEQARAGAGAAALLRKLVGGFARRGLRTVVSFDVDAVQCAHAPGVSAPQSDGFSPGELFSMATFCGESEGVITAGFFELAPPLDEGGRTTRLVATAMHRLLSGLSRRGGPRPSQRRRPRR